MRWVWPDPRLRRIHVRLSAMWGVGLLLEVAARLVVIGHFSVDVANGINSTLSLSVVGVLVLATIVVIRRVPGLPASPQE